jgi:hypothetical protein
MPADALDVRMARLEGAYEQIDRRLAGFEHRFERLEGTIATNRTRADRQFFWTIGLIVVSIILPLATRVLVHA